MTSVTGSGFGTSGDYHGPLSPQKRKSRAEKSTSEVFKANSPKETPQSRLVRDIRSAIQTRDVVALATLANFALSSGNKELFESVVKSVSNPEEIECIKQANYLSVLTEYQGSCSLLIESLSSSVSLESSSFHLNELEELLKSAEEDGIAAHQILAATIQAIQELNVPVHKDTVKFLVHREASPYNAAAERFLAALQANDQDQCNEVVLNTRRESLDIGRLITCITRKLDDPMIRDLALQLIGQQEPTTELLETLFTTITIVQKLSTAFQALSHGKVGARATLQEAIAESKIAYIPYVACLKEIASRSKTPELGNQIIQKDVLPEATQFFTTLLERAITSNRPSYFHQVVDFAKSNDLDAKALLQAAIVELQQSNAPTGYAERVFARFDALTNVPLTSHGLDPFELLRISFIAEFFLTVSPLRVDTTRLKKSHEGIELDRSVLLDFSTKTVVIISGKFGEIDAKGNFGKVRSVVEVSLAKVGEMYKADALHIVRKTPLPGREFSALELELEKEFGDLRMIAVYDHKGREKRCFTQLLYRSDWREEVNSGGFVDEKRLLANLTPVVATIALMHARKVIHRDLKLENLLIGVNSGLNGSRVADFGLAYRYILGMKIPMAPDYPICTYGNILCTSPELIAGTLPSHAEKYHYAQDMFALGVALYMAVTKTTVPWYDFVEKWFKSFATVKEPEKLYNPAIIDLVNRARADLFKSSHPLAAIVCKLLDPDPNTRMTITELQAALGAP